jgi:hypothetical protein
LLIPELQQKGIGKTTADWVIVLDADVLVPKEAQKEILEKITDSSVDGYYLRHKNYFLGKPLECHFGEHKILKLFRNGKAEFEGKHAHEAIMFTGRDIGTIENFLIHNAHPSISVFLRKANLYSSQDAKKLAKGEKAGIAKRGMVDPGFYEFIISPVLYFLNFYLRRGAYKDGLRGLILSVLFSYYIFLETAKVFEIKNVN